MLVSINTLPIYFPCALTAASQIVTGTLEQLMRNKEMQYKYDVWSKHMKANFGSTGMSFDSISVPVSVSPQHGSVI